MNTEKAIATETAKGRTLHGFTLVELLVVITIISILMGLLLPVLVHAKQKAQEVFCLNNESQIYRGIIMYVGDYRGWLPYFYPDAKPLIEISDAYSWKAASGYISYKLIYMRGFYETKFPGAVGCPSISYGDPGTNGYIAYAINRTSCRDYPKDAGKRLSQIRNPSRKFLLADGNSTRMIEKVSPLHTRFSHSRGANFMFCDGHGEWLPEYIIPLSDTGGEFPW